jgi:hypothetical protein
VFIEQFNEKLLVKQKKAPLQMVDVAQQMRCKEISEQQFPAPAAFIFLYENALFLTFARREIAVWNFEGQRIAYFEQHFNWSEPQREHMFAPGAREHVSYHC